uniref:Uncharacterized protein n=1 Tax=Rhizophora mucronata TaxID=61149 RepID=A0A2P2LGY3_RHIMU
MSGSYSRKSSVLRALRSQTLTHISDPTTIRAMER